MQAGIMGPRRYGRQRSTVFTGIVLIALGTILLLKNYGILSFSDLRDFWPVLPMAWGAQLLFRGRSTFGYLVGGMAVALGGLKLLDNLGVISISSKLYGPLILICLGVAFLVCNLRQDQGNCRDQDAEEDSKASFIHPMVIFGGVKRRIDSQVFEGGEILAMFGGVEVDLRKAKLKSDMATIEANALFGGCHLRVPESWTVEVRGTGAFGGYEDKTIPPRPEEGLPLQKLILTGSAVFGGIVVEN